MRLHWWSFPNDTTEDKFVNLMPLEVRQTPTLCSWSSPSPLKGVPVPTRASQLHQSWFQPRGNDSKGLFYIWASVWLLHCKDFLLPVQMPFRREQSHNSIGYQLILNQAQRHTQLPCSPPLEHCNKHGETSFTYTFMDYIFQGWDGHYKYTGQWKLLEMLSLGVALINLSFWRCRQQGNLWTESSMMNNYGKKLRTP